MREQKVVARRQREKPQRKLGIWWKTTDLVPGFWKTGPGPISGIGTLQSVRGRGREGERKGERERERRGREKRKAGEGRGKEEGRRKGRKERQWGRQEEARRERREGEWRVTGGGTEKRN